MDPSTEGLAILELDLHQESFMTWVYPALNALLTPSLLINRSGLHLSIDNETNSETLKWSFSQWKSIWIYQWTQSLSPFTAISKFCITLFSRHFHPQKYYILSKLLAWKYEQESSPPILLKCWLSCAIGRPLKEDDIHISGADPLFLHPQDIHLSSSLHDVVAIFGAHTIQIWANILLQKKIIVYSQNRAFLLKIIQSLSLFSLDPTCFDHLHPYMTLASEELEYLSSLKSFLSGFIDAKIKNQKQIYHILLDLDQAEIVTESNIKDIHIPTKVEDEMKEYLKNKVDKPNSNPSKMIEEFATINRHFAAEIFELQSREVSLASDADCIVFLSSHP